VYTRAKLFIIFVIALAATGVAQTPQLLVESLVDPQEIFTKSSGQSPDSAAIKILLRGLPAPERPIDVVFLLDRSASVNLSTVKKIGKEFVQHLHENDRIAVVGFAETAEMLLPLSPDRAQVYQIIDGAQPGKKTALGEALALAIDELVNNGRPKHSARSSCPQMGTVSWGACPCPKPSAPERITFPFMPWASAGPPIASPSARSPRSPGERSLELQYPSLRKHPEKTRSPGGRALRAAHSDAARTDYFESAFEPAQVRRGAKGATVLEWNLPVVVAGETRTVSFQIGARQSGPITPKALIEYRDPKNKLQKREHPHRDPDSE
jgi:hypothetical protein